MWHFDLLALETIEGGCVVIRVEVCALGMHPTLTFIAHNPFLSIIAKVEIDLLTVEAVTFLLVLARTYLTQILYIIFVC